MNNGPIVSHPIHAPLYFLGSEEVRLHAVVQLELEPAMQRARYRGEGWKTREGVLNLLLDTGATVSVLDEGIALGEHLAPQGEEHNRLETIGVGGYHQANSLQFVSGLYIQGVALPDLPVMRIPFDHIAGQMEENYGCPIHGLMGNDLLVHARATISYARNSLTLRLPYREGGGPVPMRVLLEG